MTIGANSPSCLNLKLNTMLKAIKRLWVIATCNHVNQIVTLKLEDSTEIKICQKCGRVTSVMDDGDRKHNQHKANNFGL